MSLAGTWKVELSARSRVYRTVAFDGRWAWNAEGVHSNAVVASGESRSNAKPCIVMVDRVLWRLLE